MLNRIIIVILLLLQRSEVRPHTSSFFSVEKIVKGSGNRREHQDLLEGGGCGEGR